MLYLDEPKCFALPMNVKQKEWRDCSSTTIHSCVCILFPHETHIFLPKYSSFFHTSQSLPYQVVILGLKSQGKDDCHAHQIQIVNAWPIFKQLPFHHFQRKILHPHLQPLKIFLLSGCIKIIVLFYMYKEHLFIFKLIIFINMFLLFSWFNIWENS